MTKIPKTEKEITVRKTEARVRLAQNTLSPNAYNSSAVSAHAKKICF